MSNLIHTCSLIVFLHRTSPKKNCDNLFGSIFASIKGLFLFGKVKSAPAKEKETYLLISKGEGGVWEWGKKDTGYFNRALGVALGDSPRNIRYRRYKRYKRYN